MYAFPEGTVTFQPEFTDGSSVVSVLAETADFSFLIAGLVVLFLILATFFIVVSKRNVNAVSGEHSVSSTSYICVLRNVLIVFLSASLIVGYVASFKAAFADEVNGNEISFSAVVNYDSNYGVSSVDVSVVNHSNFEVTIPASALSGIWCGELNSSESLNVGETFSTIFYPEGETLSEQIIYMLTDSPVLSIENGAPAPNVPLCFYVNYDGWKATFLQNLEIGSGIKKDNGEAWLDCANNTCLNYVPEIGNYLKEHALEKGYTFIEWNTSADGTGETVDAAYLASHPLTSDVNYYAIWKKADADSSSVDDSQKDNPAQLGTSGDVADTPEVTDFDAVDAEADANKDNAEAADPAQDIEGTKEGDQADQTV